MAEALFSRPTLPHRGWLLRILRLETVGGLLMLAAAVLAMAWANSPWRAGYFRIVQTEVGPATLHLQLPLGTWAADLLLGFFFFLAGIELKHEITQGSLSRPAQAVVPVAAAISGMVVPAAIYVGCNIASPQTLGGWGIPMATDIAFALAVLAIMGRGLPLALRAFLLTLAVVDDLGAILVIAVFYSHDFHPVSLLLALITLAAWRLLQVKHVRGTWATYLAYLPLALLSWYFVHESGIHATVAGVVLGLLTRGRPEPGQQRSPAERAEHTLRPFVAGVAVPVFAFMSAGTDLSGVSPQTALSAPVTLGVALGLLVGKPIGVIAGSYLTARFTRASLNPSLKWADVVAVGFLAGIGFTVSLLIAELAFISHDEYLTEAKLGIVLATVGAAAISAILLARRRAALRTYSEEEERDDNNDGIPDVYQA